MTLLVQRPDPTDVQREWPPPSRAIIQGLVCTSNMTSHWRGRLPPLGQTPVLVLPFVRQLENAVLGPACRSRNTPSDVSIGEQHMRRRAMGTVFPRYHKHSHDVTIQSSQGYNRPPSQHKSSASPRLTYAPCSTASAASARGCACRSSWSEVSRKGRSTGSKMSAGQVAQMHGIDHCD